MSSLDSLPSASRIWIFAAAAPFSDAQTTQIERALASFTDTWSSHGARVRGGFEIRHRQFIIAASDGEQNAVSGCSIDGMFHAVADILKDAGATLADTADIFHRDDNRVVVTDRPAFAKLVREGRVCADTIVFDNAIQTLADIRAERWETPFAKSWHAAHFNRPRAQSAESAA